MMRTVVDFLKAGVLAALFILLMFTEMFGNLYCLVANRGWFIPHESSLFTFRETVSNTGSGEWWLYGEDENNYYCALVTPYLVISRSNTCTGFDPHQYTTWCDGPQ